MINRIRSRLKVYKDKNPDVSGISLVGVLIQGAWRVFVGFFYLRKCTSIGKWVSVNGRPIIGNLGQIVLGNEVRIWSTIVKARLYTGPKGKLIVGNNTNINGAHIDARFLIQIGNYVRIAPYTIILDSDFHDIKNHFSDVEAKPVVIEDNVWLATRCTILKGVRVGEGSVVAAGAVVTKDVPPYSVVAGVPARVIKKIK
jgi:maltose O-acetyltransferase